MADRITQDFALISEYEIIDLYKQAGFALVKSFVQVLNYYGFIGLKHSISR